MSPPATTTPPDASAGGVRRRLLTALGLHRRVLRSWALYDWANSAFATTIMAVVLPIYYVRVAAATFAPNLGQAYWGYTTALGLLLITVVSPILGTMADYLGAKKRFLAAFMLLGAVSTGLLWFVRSGDWLLASLLFVGGNIGFTGSIVFYDSLLPHIADEQEIDRVSAGGWAVGYIGGGLLLAANAVMISKPALFGFADAGAASRASFVMVALWWALFTIPLLRDVPEPPRELEGDESPRINPFTAGFARLAETLREARNYPDLFKFLAAFWLYSDGLGTIVKMAAVYGTSLGIAESDLIGALLLTQFIGVPFTFLFGAISDRIGNRRAIYITLVGYTIISLAGYFLSEAWHFWVLAAAVGTVQGGAQSLSRSLYATMIPRHKSSEFFSFFGVFDKFSGIFGPLLFGLVSQITGSGRFGIVAIVVFFIAGIVILSRVDVDAGRAAARREDATLHPLPAAGA